MTRYATIFVRIIASLLTSFPVTAHAQVSRDSAGIQTVTYAATFQPTARWQIGRAPMLSIGQPARSTNEEFNEISGMVRFADGTVAVGNGSTREIRFFGSDGKFLGKVGRRGEGPGEFQTLSRLFLSGDTLLAADVSGRVTRFSQRRTLLGTIPPPMAGRSGAPIGYFSDGSFAYQFTLPFRQTQQSGSLNVLANVDRIKASVVVAKLLDNIIATTMIGTKNGAIEEIFVARTLWAVSPSGICSVNTGTYRITCADVEGKPRLIMSWDKSNTPVTAQVKAAYVKALSAVPLRSESGISRPRTTPIDVSQMHFAATMPVIAKLMRTRDGELWVMDYFPERPLLGPMTTPAPTTPTWWTVFSPEGRMLARVALPPRFNPMEFGRDYVLGVFFDADNAESVAMYRISRPTG